MSKIIKFIYCERHRCVNLHWTDLNIYNRQQELERAVKYFFYLLKHFMSRINVPKRFVVVSCAYVDMRVHTTQIKITIPFKLSFYFLSHLNFLVE